MNCPTCAVYIAANTAQAHELRIARRALRILASMLGEPADMTALRTMAELQVRQEDVDAMIGLEAPPAPRQRPKGAESVAIDTPCDAIGGLLHQNAHSGEQACE